MRFRISDILTTGSARFIAEYLRPRLPQEAEIPRSAGALIDRLDRYRAQSLTDDADPPSPSDADDSPEEGDQQ